jgi:hypothetical protein
MRSLSNCCGLLVAVLLLSLPSFSNTMCEPDPMMPIGGDGCMVGMCPHPTMPMDGGMMGEMPGYCPDENDPMPGKFMGSWTVDVEATQAANTEFDTDDDVGEGFVINWSPVDPSSMPDLLNAVAADNHCAVAVGHMGVVGMEDLAIPFAIIKGDSGYQFGIIYQNLEHIWAPVSIIIGQSEDGSDDRLSFVEGSTDHIIMKRALVEVPPTM